MEDQLKFGYWFVTHKLLLKKILIIALIVINASFWLPTLYLAFRMYALYGPRHARMMRELSVNLVNPAALEAARPQPPDVANVLVLNTSGNRYDFAAVVKNNNPQWYARFTYRFAGEGVTTPAATGVLLPGQEAVLPILGFESASRIRGARLEFTEFSWKRISRHEIPDPAAFVAERTNFVIADAAYAPGPPARSTFTIANNTAFGFWNVDLVVLLKRDRAIVGVNRITITQLRSGETRPVDLAWFDSAGSVTSVEVRPMVDIFNPAAFLPPGR